jgi:hypothetical protein
VEEMARVEGEMGREGEGKVKAEMAAVKVGNLW